MQLSEGKSKARPQPQRERAMKWVKNNNSGKQVQLSQLGPKWQTLK